MLELVKELKKRGLTKRKVASIKSKDLSKIFKKCNTKFIKKALKKKEHVIGVKLPGFEGLLKYELQQNYRLGTEISEISKVTGGVGGILHSDELPKLGISDTEVDNVKKELNCKTCDGYFLIVGPKKNAYRAIDGVLNTFKMWLDAKTLLPEVRSPRTDGTTGFLRPLPGKARMYPETDAKPIELTSELIEKINELQFEMPEERIQRYQKSYKLSKELARQLALHPQNELFEQIIQENKVSSNLVANTILSTIVDLRRQGHQVEYITDNLLLDMFAELNKGSITNSAIERILITISETKGMQTMEKIILGLGLEKLDKDEITKVVLSIIKENIDLITDRGMGSMGLIMRLAMEQFAGKAEGKLVSNIVRNEIQSVLKKQ